MRGLSRQIMSFANLLGPVLKVLCLFGIDRRDGVVCNFLCRKSCIFPTLQLQKAADGTRAGQGKDVHLIGCGLFGASR